MNSSDIRNQFQQYFTTHGHHLVPSSSLIPKGDSSLLFVNAGMNQFKNYFLGLASPPYPQICSIQKCLRAGGKHNDLEQVGISPYHHTFFEMMGSFSFGSYFKKEAIFYAFDFLTNHLNLPKDRLWVSIFKKDKDSAQIWKTNHHIPNEKIFLLEAKDNFWRMGDTGPCGPCSEIYYYDGPKKYPSPEDMLEVWNLVFMEFNEDHRGTKTQLPRPCIDTGMGLERLTAILQGVKDNYHTDFFKTIIQSIEEAAGKKYHPSNIQDKKQSLPFRILADHARAVCFLISDGVQPANMGAGYVLRRILRRALFYSNKLHSDKNLLWEGASQTIHLMQSIYPQLTQHSHLIQSTIQKERQLFIESLETGKAMFFQKIKHLSTQTIDAALIWDLYSTYGFPPDLTQLLANENNLITPEMTLKELKTQFDTSASKKITRSNDKENFKKNCAVVIRRFLTQESLFTGYERNTETGQILLIVSTETFTPISILEESQSGWLIINKTCFYPEGGGAVGDTGHITSKTGKAQVLDTQQQGGFIFHKITMQEGIFKKDQNIHMSVNTQRRKQIATSHSATHLLHHALREILGPETKQMGSLVEPGKLRFDFYSPSAPSPKQLKNIEHKVTQSIQVNHLVSSSVLPYETAVKNGALFLEKESYDKQVRVISIGASQELCGGIHVQNSSEIDGFKIISCTGIKSSVRRILAYTGERLKSWLQEMEIQNKQIRSYLNWPIPNKLQKENPFIQWIQTKEKEIKYLKKQLKNILFAEENKKSPPNIFQPPPTINKPVSSHQLFHQLVQQNESLRAYLNIPLPREKETENIPLSIIQKTQQQINLLKTQINNLSKKGNIHQLIKQTQAFYHQHIKGYLLTTTLAIEDRKWLVEVASKIHSNSPSPAVTILLGENQSNEQHPLVVIVSKPLQDYISAGDILKNIIAPFLEGRGGGGKHIAQGIITNKKQFEKLKQKLLIYLNSKKVNNKK